jgi:ubiquinone biosynthesis protein
LTTTVTHLWRVLRWGRTLGKQGALRPFETMQDAPPALRVLARLARFGTFAPKEPRYADALQALGPAAIKLGQALATRPDLVGASAAKDLTRLQDRLPPFAFAEVEKTITIEFGIAPAALFASIDPVCVGAASIAQVHRARTLEGKDVAIKILRPHIEQVMADHITTYQWLAAKIESIGGEAARLRPRLIIETFRTWVSRELDLRLEAASASELADNMRADTRYHVPSVDWARTSRRMFTLDWIDGAPLTDPAALDQAGVDRPALARTLVLTFLKQAIEDGVFHADMHHGNLFVDADGRLNVIDFGIMGRLDPLARRYLAEILYGLLTRNYARVAEIHFEAGYVPGHHNVKDFASALRAVGEPILGKPIKDISPARLLDQLFAITRSFDMQTQPHLLLLQKTMMMVEGMAVHIDPAANMWDIAAPYLTDWIKSELGPEARLADGIRRLVKDISQIPDVLRRAAEQVPRAGAAPPSPPLPELPNTRPWAIYGMILLAGAVIGWLLARIA